MGSTRAPLTGLLDERLGAEDTRLKQKSTSALPEIEDRASHLRPEPRNPQS